ncbi:treacle protein-like [Zingiber officinale]|uniref:treacle protein-like n=1 Tax=Zingiber officinale TaxID=94328 RepID=UPI001C4A9EAD|nr:treacle protein-like [Zingiber officinale]XP_042383148.1 treacle protein-like [Zingiber officinale]
MMDNKELEDRLRDVGNRLTSPPSAVDELLPLLDHAEILLSRVEQSPKQSMSNALKPSMKALVDKELLGHSELDVKVAVTSCLSEITRITAPETPYGDDLMKEIFQRIVQSFENLDDMSSRSFPKRVSVLETVAKVRSCVLMLDLECDSLILEMFCHFLKTLRPNHSEKIFSSMEMIMTLVLEESEDISLELLLCLLNSVKSDNKDISPAVRKLGEKVISNCSGKLKPYLTELSQSGGIILSEYTIVVTSICLQNLDNLEQNINASGEIMADDSKQSERTVSDELLKGSEEMEQELGCPEEVTSTKKSPKPASSNRNVQMGKSESTIEPSSPKQMSEPSRLSPPSDQSDRVVLSNKDASDNGDVKETLPIEKQSTDATRRKRGRPRSKLTGKKHQGREINEQSASSLQKEESETGDKNITPQKESDEINNPDDVPIVSEDKSQKQRSRKGSVSKIGHGSSSQKSRVSKAKQHEDLKGKEIVDVESIKKEVILESNAEMPNTEGNIQGSGKTKSKRKLDHVGKEEFILESDSKMLSHEDSIQESAKTKSKRKLDHVAKESTKTLISNKVLDGSIVGSKIRVWWPMDKNFYDGVIDSYDKASKKHKIMYSDGDVEVLLLKKERWEFIEAGSKSTLEQGKEGSDSPDPAEEPKSKRAKVGSSSVPQTASTKPSTESGATSTGRRKGRPPKARPLNLDGSPGSSAKGNEQEIGKPIDEKSESATKLKDDSMAKDDISKSKPTPKTGRGRKVNSRRKSIVDDTPVPATGSKSEDDDCASASTKVKNDAPKSKSIDSPKAVQTSKGTKTGRETKASANSEEKPKVPESEESQKALTKAKSPESEALLGKKRRRKRQT